jgi:LytS/YehU family sensor histidine kinase
MAGLIYILAPKFLFNKKYILFFGISFITIGVLAWITANFPDTPLRPHIRRGDGPPVRPPSRFFIHYLLILLAYLIATFVETFMFAQRKQEEVVLSKNENLQTELKLLKSQINPHFLFNALNNIYALSAIDASKTQQSISHLSNMLRYVLYECDKPLVALEKEIDYIENYITLFSLKSSTPYNISKQFNVALKQQPIAPMLLIPFIENTFKHSGIEKRQGAFIHMELNATRNEIVFKIKNSYDPNAKAKDALGGIGLDNVKKRLQIVYPNAYDLHISTIDQTFSVTLNIRFNESH